MLLALELTVADTVLLALLVSELVALLVSVLLGVVSLHSGSMSAR